MSTRSIFAAAAVSAIPAYRYWRIYITALNGALNYCEIAEVELRGTPGGTKITTGSVTESSYYITYDENGEIFAYYPGINTVDGVANNPYSIWISAGSPTVSAPQWLRYDLTTAKVVREVAIYMYSGGPYSLKDFKIQGSADGTTFTDVKSFTGVAAWTGWQAFNLV